MTRNILRACLAACLCLFAQAAAGQPTPIYKIVLYQAGSVAALRAYASTTMPGMAHLSGYAADGDGGDGDYRWSGSSTATDDGCGVVKPASVTTGRWLAVMPARGLDPRRCGAKFDGTTDDTTALQTALSALCTAATPGGILAMPAGKTLVSASVGLSIACEGVVIRGAGRGNSASGTVMTISGAGSAPILSYASTVKSLGVNAFPLRITDLMIVESNTGATATQTGTVINLSHCQRCTLDNLTIWGAKTGITVFAGQGTMIRDTTITQVAAGGTGILWYGYDGTSPTDHSCQPSSLGTCAYRSDILELSNVVIDSQIVGGTASGVCIHQLDFAATLQASAVICNQFAIGFLADCPDSSTLDACPQFISMFDFETEPNGANASTSAGLYLSDVVHFNCHDCQVFGYTTTNDVVALSTRLAGASDIQFVGGKIGYALNDCILSSAGQVTVQGVQIAGCGQAGAGYWGIELRQNSPGGIASGAGYSGQHRVIGNSFCWEASGNSAATSHSGVTLTAGNQNFNVVQGNTFKGCVAGVTDSSGGGNESVTGNVGP